MALRVSLEPLAGAVAALGGVGLIAGSGLVTRNSDTDELVQRIRTGRKLADGGILGVGIMHIVSQFDQILDTAIQERVDVVVIGAGFAREPFQKLAAAGIPGWAIISSEKLARIVTRLPAIAGVVVESGQAGGHLGPKDPEISTWDLFPGIYRTLREGGFSGPVVAAGGIRYGWEVRRLLEMGADGVQIGTLFAMTDESSASPTMKGIWRRSAGSKVTAISPVGMPSRAVVEQSLEKLPKLLPSARTCINCLKFCAHREDHGQKHCIYRSLINSAAGRLSIGENGEVEDGLVFCGGRVGEITDIVPVARRMERLLEEMEEDARPLADAAAAELVHA
ncbi:MAG: nitronate monooxygenase [Dehalococcoidales bacterium]|nr:nitronate monooxygenase [Dehalococcoidales bacterium]